MYQSQAEQQNGHARAKRRTEPGHGQLRASCVAAAFVAGSIGALGLIGAGCGGTGAFGLTSDDNNPAKLAEAFKRVQVPAAGKPMNRMGKPLAFLVTRRNAKAGKKQSVVAYDLAGKSVIWTAASDVRSKLVVGSDFVAYVEKSGNLVSRAIDSGKQLWSKSVGDSFVGASADETQVYYVVTDKSGPKPVWWLVAVNGTSGEELWRADAPGQLGVPAARGGLVFSPFLKQWLAVLDAKTGEQLARIRGIDEEISFVRATSDGVFFGSRLGVFMLDERAASGKRAQSTYASAKLPPFVRAHYYWDAFDPVQTGYTAYDRNRILWRAAANTAAADTGAASNGAALAFTNGEVVVHTYRFFFAFNAVTGALEWAYNHPRVDVVASSQAGASIVFASVGGDLGALDPASGKRIYQAKFDGKLVGATFDANGWRPHGESASGDENTSTAATLAAIARDRDARYNAVKLFAIEELATIEGENVSRDLLALLRDPRTPPKIYEKAVASLIARKDPAAVPHLLETLSVVTDFIAGTKPTAVGVAAAALAMMNPSTIEAGVRAKAVSALVLQLQSPDTPTSDLTAIVRALGAIGGGKEIAPLRGLVLMYRADPGLGGQISVLSAAMDVLLRRGGAAERALVEFVAADARTHAAVSEYAATALQAADSAHETPAAAAKKPGATARNGPALSGN